MPRTEEAKRKIQRQGGLIPGFYRTLSLPGGKYVRLGKTRKSGPHGGRMVVLDRPQRKKSE